MTSAASGPKIVARRVATMNYTPRHIGSGSGAENEVKGKTHCKSNGIGEAHHAGKNGTDLPRYPDSFTLMPRWPEKIEEETCAEYCGDEDANEDVERCDANEVVIVFGRTGLAGDKSLLVGIVCASIWLHERLMKPGAWTEKWREKVRT